MVYIGYSMLLLEVLCLLCENKIDFVLKRYGSKIIAQFNKEWNITEDNPVNFSDNDKLQDTIDGCKKIDSSERYMEWIVKQYISGLFRFDEDGSQVKEDLESFDKNKRKMQHQDINRYNLRTLRQELKRFDVSGNEGDFGAEIQKAIENKDIQLTERCEGFVIYRALTKDGAILLGKGGGHKSNKWCTARTDASNMFNHYNKTSDVYVAIFDNGKRFQFDIDRVEHLVQNCMDEMDSDVLSDESSDYGYWLKVRESNLAQSEYQKSMERHWTFNSTMTTWEEFVQECIKHNKQIMPHLSIILQSVGFKDHENYIVSDLIGDFAINVMKLSDACFVEDIQTLGVLYKRNYNQTFNKIVDDEIVNNKKITNRVNKVFKQGSEQGYNIDEYNVFVEHLYAIGNSEQALNKMGRI